MDENTRINAISAPGSSVFPSVDGFLGIVMLDTRFPRPPGDIGHPGTFNVPTRRLVLPGAWPDKVVQSAAGLRASGLCEGFVGAVRQLEREGALAITTSCGFLVLLQRDLQAAARVPVVTSSLVLLPDLLRDQRRVGVLTISGELLTEEHLLAAGVPSARVADVVVQGVDASGEFARAILGNRPEMDLAWAQADVVAAAMALQAQAPDLACVVLECTNMPPYRAAIEAATGMKTWALVDDERLTRPWRQA